MNDGDKEQDPADASAAPASDDAVASSKSASKPAQPTAPPRPTVLQWVFLAVVAISSGGLDLGTKCWAQHHLSVPARIASPVCTPPPGMDHYFNQNNATAPRVLIANYLEFRYAENCGGAWGLLHGANEKFRRPFFLLVTIGALFFILYLYRSLEPNQRAMRVALPLVLGGAIGNLVDRMRIGYVVDFIDAHWREQYHWPTFNVADIAITVGIGLMILEYILGPKRAPAKAKPKAKTAAT